MKNKVHRPLAKLTKRQRRGPRLIKIRDEMGDITKDTEKNHRIRSTYLKNLYFTKLENFK